MTRTRTRLRRHRTSVERSGHGTEVTVEVDQPCIAGDARRVAGGAVIDRARAGGHALVVGSAVVADTAVVTDRTVIAGHAQVCGSSTVSGHAAVIDGAWVGGSVWIFDHAVIRDLASVGGRAQVFGTAQVAGQATVTDQAWVFGAAQVDGAAHVGGRTRVGGGRVTGTARIDGDIRVRPTALIGDGADVQLPDHLQMVELACRVYATLYRCTDGGVGAGLPDGWHGPLHLDELPEELARHRHFIHQLAQRWTPQPDSAEPCASMGGDSAESLRNRADNAAQLPGRGHTDGDSLLDDLASWEQWAPPQLRGEPDVRLHE